MELSEADFFEALEELLAIVDAFEQAKADWIETHPEVMAKMARCAFYAV